MSDVLAQCEAIRGPILPTTEQRPGTAGVPPVPAGYDIDGDFDEYGAFDNLKQVSLGNPFPAHGSVSALWRGDW